MGSSNLISMKYYPINDSPGKGTARIDNMLLNGSQFTYDLYYNP